jgi:hypothetical protein
MTIKIYTFDSHFYFLGQLTKVVTKRENLGQDTTKWSGSSFQELRIWLFPILDSQPF